MTPQSIRSTFIIIIAATISNPFIGLSQKKSKPSELYRQIEKAKALKSSITEWPLFKWIKKENEVSILSVDRSYYKSFGSNNVISIEIPTGPQSNMEAIVIESNNLSNDISWHQLKTYKGILDNDPQSFVTISISPKKIEGIISNQSGNYVLKSNHLGQVEFFSTHNAKRVQWQCQSSHENGMKNNNAKVWNNSRNKGDTIKVHIVCDYDLYTSQDHSVSQTINYVKGLMNSVAAIYQNEQITLIVDDIFVWNTPDPYNKVDIRSTLMSFKNHMNENFQSDVAMLLSSNNQVSGGMAYIDGACDKTNAYSYANLSCNTPSTEDYTWEIHVISHELGHNLGSPHTHDCAWGPNKDQPLDDCFTNDCNTVYAKAAGTIMSYCHLPGEKGINLSLGFGDEPGNLIRSKMYQCHITKGDRCANPNKIIVNRKKTNISCNGPSNGMSASRPDADHSTWYSFEVEYNGLLNVQSCGQMVDTRLHIYSGSCGSLDHIISVDDNCDKGNGLFYAASIDSLRVYRGQTYFIEWDDRWSSNAFDFSIMVTPMDYIDDQCNNGVQDEGEEGIDCGGTACAPCNECELERTPSNDISDVVNIRMANGNSFNGHVDSTGDLLLSTDGEMSFEAGFEIEVGGILEAIIETCDEYLERISNRPSMNIRIDESISQKEILASLQSTPKVLSVD